MRKTKEDTEISKLRILLAAEEEFCLRGFVAANLDSIAKVAGLTKGAIFWHYKSKAESFQGNNQTGHGTGESDISRDLFLITAHNGEMQGNNYTDKKGQGL